MGINNLINPSKPNNPTTPGATPVNPTTPGATPVNPTTPGATVSTTGTATNIS
jgi:hypothetical protein